MAAHADAMTEWVGVRKIAVYKSTADHCHGLRSQGVARVESAARNDRNVQLCEVAVAHRDPNRTLKLAWNRGAILELNVLHPFTVTVRKRIGQFGMRYTGQCAQLLQTVAVPRGLFLRSVVASHRKSHVEGQHLVGLEGVGKVQQPAHAFRDQRTSDHERDGQGNLGHSKNVPQTAATAGAGGTTRSRPDRKSTRLN